MGLFLFYIVLSIAVAVGLSSCGSSYITSKFVVNTNRINLKLPYRGGSFHYTYDASVFRL